MGFSEKTPEYKACVEFIQLISPKHKTSTTNNVIDLTSPAEAEDETMENDDIFCGNTKDIETKLVWAIEHFKYYLYGKHFSVITDHQASISALNASERSKTSQNRLTRWIDRLIPFHFDIKHFAGSKMGLID